MSYGPTDTGVSKVTAFVAMDLLINNTNVSKVTAFVAMDSVAFSANVSKITAFVAMDQASGPTPVDQLPAVQRAYALFAQHQPGPFAGRRQRPAAPVIAAPPGGPAVGAPWPLARVVTAHFSPDAFAGRRAKRAVRPAPAPPFVPAKSIGIHQALHRFNAFFDPRPYAGRRQNRFLFAFGGGTGNPPRASQLIVDSLVTSPAGARASQLILDALTRDPAGARVSQLVAEALYQQTNPGYVRASQLVLEVLVPFTELPVIPYYPDLAALTWDYVKRPKESVGRSVGSSGREIAVNYWANPMWEWDLSYDVLGDTGQNVGPNTQSDIKTMLGFFLSQVGTFYPFYFKDPDDNTVTGQAIGVGDGVTKAFVFVRTYGLSTLGPFTGTEPVGNVDERVTGPVIYIAGTVQDSDFTIDTSVPYANTVTFGTAPAAGQVITADFSFCYFCRLKEDSLEYAKYSTGLWELKRCTLFSLKN